jgi:hypothetical protein
MTAVMEDKDASLPWQDGWTHEYRVKRDDGNEVRVTIDYSATDGSSPELEAVEKDRGRALALERAESPQAAQVRAHVTIHCRSDGVSDVFETDDEPEPEE